MENEKKCPYCNDIGQIKFRLPDKKDVPRDKFGNPIEAYSYYTCFCVNNKLVTKSFNKLHGTQDVTPEDTIKAGKFAGFRNLVLYGDERKFLFLVKATMVLHANYHHTFEFLNGIELVHKYYVEQAPGIYRSLADLEDKDLVIFVFDASPDNKAQNTTVLEVVKSRVRMNDTTKSVNKERVERPTWIYSPSIEALEKSKEYSAGIQQYLECFERLNLDKYEVPFSLEGAEPSRKRSKLQSNLGKL